MTDPYEAPLPADGAEELVAASWLAARFLSVLTAIPAIGLVLIAAWLARAGGSGPPYVAEQMAVTFAIEGAFAAAATWQLHRLSRAAVAARRRDDGAVTRALAARRALLVTVVLAGPGLAVESALYVVLARALSWWPG